MARSALATTKLRVFEARRGFDFAALCAFTRAWIDLLHSRGHHIVLTQFADANDLYDVGRVAIHSEQRHRREPL